MSVSLEVVLDMDNCGQVELSSRLTGLASDSLPKEVVWFLCLAFSMIMVLRVMVSLLVFLANV
jgi:hypothetical protein